MNKEVSIFNFFAYERQHWALQDRAYLHSLTFAEICAVQVLLLGYYNCIVITNVLHVGLKFLQKTDCATGA